MEGVSVVIPTYNGGPLFEEVLERVFRQKMQPSEVIVIDSSSSDGTELVAKAFPVEFHRISKAAFGHGKTRNYGATLANGEYVVFLTQDAMPSDDLWLLNLVQSLDSPRVAGAFSRQVARDQAAPMEKFFYSEMYPAQSKIIGRADAGSGDVVFSNASSAIRKSFIMEHPFAEDILMSEDLAWALQILDEDYEIMYEADSLVTHSHDASIQSLIKRYYCFGISHRQIARVTGHKPAYFRRGVAVSVQELRYLVDNGQIAAISPALSYEAAKAVGLILGKYDDRMPPFIRNLLK